MTRPPRRRTRAAHLRLVPPGAIGAVLLALGLAACTPPSDGEPATSPTASGSSESDQLPATTPATAPPAPATAPGEVARSVHVPENADGVPETADTSSDVVATEGRYAVAGACSGDPAEMPFTLSTAAPDQERATLLEGSIPCDGEVMDDGFDYQFAYDGPVQLTITRTDGLTGGWVTLTARS
ncbi:hypothetical protein [Litorihabitans aurantiacus]|uniref:Lipoprotein n=1 Tax=Litorihabitans aurantiacus TaxID=1930061 RepID=A0AA37XER1_9MICO|nr:hypothetical protein [Litorihabitans aurantiacus]GMA31956.1 hypothetical protein GCM10025875_19480 [Litorihabitans aurantiacus]